MRIVKAALVAALSSAAEPLRVVVLSTVPGPPGALAGGILRAAEAP